MAEPKLQPFCCVGAASKLGVYWPVAARRPMYFVLVPAVPCRTSNCSVLKLLANARCRQAKARSSRVQKILMYVFAREVPGPGWDPSGAALDRRALELPGIEIIRRSQLARCTKDTQLWQRKVGRVAWARLEISLKSQAAYPKRCQACPPSAEACRRCRLALVLQIPWPGSVAYTDGGGNKCASCSSNLSLSVCHTHTHIHPTTTTAAAAATTTTTTTPPRPLVSLRHAISAFLIPPHKQLSPVFLVLEKGGEKPGAMMERLCRKIAAVMSDSRVYTTVCPDRCKIRVLHTFFRVTRGESKADEGKREGCACCIMQSATRDVGIWVSWRHAACDAETLGKHRVPQAVREHKCICCAMMAGYDVPFRAHSRESLCGVATRCLELGAY